MNNSDNNKISCFGKVILIMLSAFLIICILCVGVFGWLYYKLTKTNDLAIYASQKLSRANKYSINIESFKNTFPIITAENFKYKKISNVSTLTIDVNEFLIYPDYLNPKIGTHSFELHNAAMFLQNRKFLMNSPNIQLFGKYCQKNIQIASSAWDAFGGKILLTGNIDTNQKPSYYNLSAKLIYVKLQDILEGTKHKGLYSGDVYGKIDIQSYSNKKSPLNGNLSLSIMNGYYYKPELEKKLNSALHKVGLHNTLKDLALSVASSSFSLNGDFILKDKSYETNNAEIRTPWSYIKFSGKIGPKSALNGTFVIKIKDYSSFNLKVKGENSKNLVYKISDSDKAKLASIFIREIGKSKGKQIKEEGKKTNKRFNRGFNRLGNRLKNLWNK